MKYGLWKINDGMFVYSMACLVVLLICEELFCIVN